VQELDQEEWVKEVRLVPQDYWEEEPMERVEHRTVLEERQVPQVRSLYAFTGQGMTMPKGEVMFLLNKTNPDWWNVRKADGTDGFVPANYVREIEPKVVQVQVRRPEKIREMQRVKKTRMVKQIIPIRRVRPAKPAGECTRKLCLSLLHMFYTLAEAEVLLL
jgi:spectrin beta